MQDSRKEISNLVKLLFPINKIRGAYTHYFPSRGKKCKIGSIWQECSNYCKMAGLKKQFTSQSWYDFMLWTDYYECQIQYYFPNPYAFISNISP